ncbi:hypothetical protein [Tenacibaculum ovolyticum]|uniref:hypothetical protein n=1 Tax=Tenacibaculum ovolyticum TaxID=104270 RepID=UPI001F238F9B|nr:hypothetical protein [Tenacibaculum ovolyticum]
MPIEEINLEKVKENLTKQELLNELPFFYRYAECNLSDNETILMMINSEAHQTNYYMIENLYKSFF